MSLERLMSFSRLLNAFSRVERVIRVPGTERMENDMEHSYHLALMAWYLINSNALDLDLHKVLAYALVHDLVEVHAGDTYVYSQNVEEIASKQAREREAATRLEEEFPEFPDLHQAIRAYEAREDRESKFVYALDKIVPLFLIQEDGGRRWKEMQVTLDMLVAKKAPQVALSSEIEPYFNELVILIREARLTAEFTQDQ